MPKFYVEYYHVATTSDRLGMEVEADSKQEAWDKVKAFKEGKPHPNPVTDEEYQTETLHKEEVISSEFEEMRDISYVTQID